MAIAAPLDTTPGPIVIFTGAGMSAESGVPTYRGKDGIWKKYDWAEVACEEAFQRNPEKVLEFHELRRSMLLSCQPHAGHNVLVQLEARHPAITIITQNIDGLHQRAGSKNVIELHGSLWRLRCPNDGKIYQLTHNVPPPLRCSCGHWLRPDIIWFSDSLNVQTFTTASNLIYDCALFVAVGTSAVVWPAAGLPQIAARNGARMIEINPEVNELSPLYGQQIRDLASKVLPKLFPGINYQL